MADRHDTARWLAEAAGRQAAVAERLAQDADEAGLVGVANQPLRQRHPT